MIGWPSDIPAISKAQADEYYSLYYAPQNLTAILVGDLNVAPLETDVWSHKQLLRVVSHTPVEVEHLEAAREAGVYLDTDRMTVFNGEVRYCRDRLLKNCCASDGAGGGMSNQSMFGVGSRLVFDALMSGRAIDAHDACDDPRTSEFRDGYLVPGGISSMLDAAIRVGGKIVGVVIGAFIMGVMNNGMSIMGIGIDYQQVIKGLVLLAAVIFDVYNKQKQG